jgi:predicted nucleic acid-binding protein
MNAAYVDTSCLVAIAFGEAGGHELARRIESMDHVFASNLLEAELRAAFVRERVPADHPLLGRITWVLPDRPLGREIGGVLAAGYLRGADLWHLASALFLAGNPRDLPFITLDERQEVVARRLGFPG